MYLSLLIPAKSYILDILKGRRIISNNRIFFTNKKNLPLSRAVLSSKIGNQNKKDLVNLALIR
jgi:hypothetical protein